ncbi:MAG TPA: polysaccharide deacetylase family protein, partial [Gemmataceae bacterium]|nr:polysaccharide deacetylase family protein [Gemmataceae bacterium]
MVLSFDVEEHYRIEAAAGMKVDDAFKGHCRERVDAVTRWLLGQLNERGIRATFFVVGEIAQDNPSLIRAMHTAGHEVACHSWDHRRVHHHTPAS